jgi:hypothetical protein
MADPSSGSGRGDQRDPASGVPPATPRWVKVSGIVVVVLALIVVVMLLLGHGPGRHSAPSAASGQASSPAVILTEFVGRR